MNISIFGMGYVGCVTSACLIKQGHNVIGVDVVDSKIGKLENGIWPIYEPGLVELNRPEVIKSHFNITKDKEVALGESEVSMICVGTPSTVDGQVELKYLEAVLSQIKEYFVKNSKNHVVLIRSTIPPGTTKKIISLNFKEVKNKVKIGFLPEFLREGSAIDDFFNPSLKVIGCEEDFPVKILDNVFPDVKGEWGLAGFEVAESIKYISNSWHALKIVFTNEIATILKEYNTDSELAMEIFCKDKILNISSNYMRPGFAYGGSCLPKDLSAALALARTKNIKTPMLDAISVSNEQMISQLESLIYQLDKKNIGFCGVSFKPNTDDIRNSPMLTVIKNLMIRKRSYQRGFNITICDNQEAMINCLNETGLKTVCCTDVEKMMETRNIIVLGPYKISNDSVIQMLEQKKVVIDLKWHKLSEEIKSHTNYRSLL